MSETKPEKLPVAFKNEEGRVLPYTATLAKHVKKLKLQPLFDLEPKPQNRRAKVQAKAEESN